MMGVCGLMTVQTMSYGEAFTKIQQATGIEDFDELMMTFINAEDENYRHYKYIDELTQEVERLKEQIVGVQEEIEQVRTSVRKTPSLHSPHSLLSQCVRFRGSGEASAVRAAATPAFSYPPAQISITAQYQH